MTDAIDRLAALLKSRNMKLVTAESCTGGLLSATLTHKEGASAFFERGFITYANEAKIESLGVQPLTIETFGAVSAQAAQEMAIGALKNSHAQLAVSITGIAGPEGGSPEKPVGTVYFGYALAGGSSGSLPAFFKGSRVDIQKQAAATAINHLLTVLEPES